MSCGRPRRPFQTGGQSDEMLFGSSVIEAARTRALLGLAMLQLVA